MVIRAGRKDGFTIDVRDHRGPWPAHDPKADLAWLYDHQHEALEAVFTHKRGIIQSPTACHRAGTLVRMFDGSLRAVERVLPGDQLMGPDSNPRRVQCLHRGLDEVLEVRPKKGEPFYCNPGHVLTLVRTDTDAVVDVRISDWQRWSKTQKHLHKLFRVPVIYPERSLPVSPYFLGVLLGDGCLRGRVGVSTVDPEIVAEVHAQAARWGLKVYVDGGPEKPCPTYLLSAGRYGPRDERNSLCKALRELGLYGSDASTKFIPREYLTAGWEQRLQLLAGLLDTDGSLQGGVFDYITKSPQLAHDIAELSRSLGLSAYVRATQKASQTGTVGIYYRLCIGGRGVPRIPTRLPRKVASRCERRKDALRTGFTVSQAAVSEPIYGFTLDGDGRYLLADFTVTHNSGKGEVVCGLVKMYPGAPCVVLVNSKDLVDDLVERLTKHLGEPIGQWGRGKHDLRRVTVCMAPSVAKALRTKAQKKFFESVQVLIIDEVHGAGSATMYQSAQAFTNAPIRVGFSATPFDRGDERSLMVAGCTGEVIHRVRFDDMVDKGVIAKPVIHAHRFPLTPVAIRQRGPLSAAWHHGYHDTMLSPTRMAAVKQLVLAAEKPCLVLLESLEHGAAVAKMLNLAGVTCEFASGELKDADRARLKREITHGDRQVVVANRIFKTGIDIPELRSVVSVGAGKAVIANIQSVGRGARRRDKQGAVVKDSFSFHDLADRDCGCRHMDRGAARYDHTACKWFDRHARARMAAYRAAGFEIKECIE